MLVPAKSASQTKESTIFISKARTPPPVYFLVLFLTIKSRVAKRSSRKDRFVPQRVELHHEMVAPQRRFRFLNVLGFHSSSKVGRSPLAHGRRGVQKILMLDYRCFLVANVAKICGSSHSLSSVRGFLPWLRYTVVYISVFFSC